MEQAAAQRLYFIRALSKLGFTLIPLKGKIPMVTEWVNTAPGHYTEQMLVKGNYGVVLRADDLVIDIDPRNFKPGDDPVSRLWARIGAPLRSFTVKTGGGGLHIYLKKSPDIQVVGGLKEFPGIEFKSSGRQVVGPGSIHPDSGKEYAAPSDKPIKITEAPLELLALIQKPKGSAQGATFTKGTGEYKNDTATRGRFISYLQDGAEVSVEGQGGDGNAFRVACKGRDFGLSPEIVWDLLLEFWNPKCQPPWDPEDLKGKVIHAYKYAQGPVGGDHPQTHFKGEPIPEGAGSPLVSEPAAKDIKWKRTQNGTLIKCFENLVNMLRFPPTKLEGILGYNEFTGRVEFIKAAPWHRGPFLGAQRVNDNDLALLKGHLAMTQHFEMPVAVLGEAAVVAAHDRPFHPVRDYLNGLRWDGTPRLDFWLRDHLGVEDSDYTRACARKTLCAAVARVMNPGCKFDHVLVLEGAQKIGKSTTIKILAGKWGADFSIDPHNKDTIQLMQGRWLIELAELEVARRTDRDALKAFITRTKDEARLAYGRTVGEFDRQSIFIASKNPNADGTYLEDDTGNRRWWPVMCKPAGGRVDFQALKDARDQLWAEAVYRFRQGEALYMDKEELESAADVNADLRHGEHAWTERIAGWIDELNKNPATQTDFLTSRQIFIDAMGGLDKQFTQSAKIAIAQVLRKLGWIPDFVWRDNRSVRGYKRGKAAC